MFQTLVCIAIALAACRGEPHESQPVAKPLALDAAAPAIDAPSPDAGAGCSIGEPTTRQFRVGMLTAPAGWCWRRLAEGDDQSGVAVDDHGRVRLHYTELSFDEPVGDVCDKRPDVHAERLHGIALRSCTLADGRSCWHLGKLANVCSMPDDDPRVASDVVHTLAAR